MSLALSKWDCENWIKLNFYLRYVTCSFTMALILIFSSCVRFYFIKVFNCHFSLCDQTRSIHPSIHWFNDVDDSLDVSKYLYEQTKCRIYMYVCLQLPTSAKKFIKLKSQINTFRRNHRHDKYPNWICLVKIDFYFSICCIFFSFKLCNMSRMYLQSLYKLSRFFPVYLARGCLCFVYGCALCMCFCII